ncbi:MAG: preprotein translocase subunit SecE [Candidatus Hydrogenedentes bacterium]|nr:preprotein translocase subunit SecE [Candidatus Hydrogenedentota bacterium]
MEKIKQFLREVRTELSKVSRIKREELVGSTTVVLCVMIIVAVIVGLLDLLCGKLILGVLIGLAG